MRRLLAPALVLLAAPSGVPQEVPTFATGVESVYLDVWVGRGATPVQGLTAADFEVKDDGVPQQVEVVDISKVPLHAILVLDTSASVAGPQLNALKTAAGAFLEGLAAGDRATLVTFSHVRRLQGQAAGDPAGVAEALDAVSASGATALRDAVFTGLEMVDPRKGRSVVMVFSDGEDRVSWLSAEAVEAVARETDATVYVVDSAGRSDSVHVVNRRKVETLDPDSAGLIATQREYARDHPGDLRRSRVPPPHETAPFLRHLAEETGGQVFRAGSADDLAESFRAVLARLKSRYLLRYEPAGVKAEGWHKIEVRLKGKEGDVRARRGYSAGSPRSD